MLDSDHEVAAKKALDIMIELYRRRIWTDERTVNMIATGCASKTARIALTSINFFLGIEQRMADDAAEDVEDAAAVEVKEHRHSRKTLIYKERT